VEIMQTDTNNKTVTASQAARGRPRSTRLRWVLAASLIVAIGLGTAAYLRYSGEGEPAYNTVAVAKGDIEKTVTALGSIKPKDSTVSQVGVDVGVQVSGQLEKVLVGIGDRVTKGQLLAEIDPSVYRTQVATDEADLLDLRAQLQQQRAQLALDKQQLDRNRGLFRQKAASQADLQTSIANVKITQAKIASLEAQIDGAKAKLDGDKAKLGYTKIYAPTSGVVVAQPAAAGQTLNANQTAPTILTIANLDTMTVWAQVAEADIPKIKVGMPVYFTTLGNPNHRWHAKVTQILPSPETVNNVVLYDVLIDIPNPDHLLMTNMTAQVFFVLGSAHDVPIVPTAALRHGPHMPAGTYRATVVTSRGAANRLIKVGLQNRTSAQVLSGLSPGDRVAVGMNAGESGDRTSRRHFGFGPHL